MDVKFMWEDWFLKSSGWEVSIRQEHTLCVISGWDLIHIFLSSILYTHTEMPFQSLMRHLWPNGQKSHEIYICTLPYFSLFPHSSRPPAPAEWLHWLFFQQRGSKGKLRQCEIVCSEWQDSLLALRVCFYFAMLKTHCGEIKTQPCHQGPYTHQAISCSNTWWKPWDCTWQRTSSAWAQQCIWKWQRQFIMPDV